MLKNLFINEFEKINLKVGNISFLTGTFLLPSAFPIGALLLLIALIISFKENRYYFFKDRWNYSIYICILIIFLSTLKNGLIDVPNELVDYNKTLIWINLFNWIPILLGYIGFQTYLKNLYQRVLFTKFLILGSLPVIFSCILQYTFKIYGPFETFYGLIIWFQKPISINSGVSGLFNNANYLSIWLSIVIPFIFYFIKNEVKNFKKISLILVCLTFSFFAISTKSRNGFFSLIFTILSFYSIKNIFYTFTTFSLFGILSNYLLNLRNINLNFFNVILKEKVLNKLLFFSPRLLIWESAIELIKNRPLFGWGASTFPFVNDISYYSAKYQHTHNIFLELAFNFGIPLSIIIFISLLFLFTKVIKNNLKFRNKIHTLHTKSWLVSSLIVLFFHFSDINLYDGKIGLIISILISGLRCILNEQESYKKEIIYN